MGTYNHYTKTFIQKTAKYSYRKQPRNR